MSGPASSTTGILWSKVILAFGWAEALRLKFPSGENLRDFPSRLWLADDPGNRDLW
jgi:hypothetical protein